ncbi:MAG TPA: type II secretion system protein, partial [Phycisphaerae bacterium]|nr:type II secretion system protein [Phycisphaerae bacterium]
MTSPTSHHNNFLERKMRIDTTRRPRDCRSNPKRSSAFTLVELLIVITIMAIIVAITVGIGRHVMASVARKRTQTAQAIIKGAIDAYIREHDGEAPADDSDAISTVSLMMALEKHDESWDMMANLDKEIFSSRIAALKDGWGNEMIYDRDGGFGGTPIITSL